METKTIFKRITFDAILFAYLLMVALIAVTAPTEEQMLQLGANAVYVAIAVVVGAVLSFVLNKNNIKTLGEHIFEPPHKKNKHISKSWYKTFWGIQLNVTFFVTLFISFIATRFSLTELFDQHGLEGAVRLFKGMATPNFEVLPQAVLAIIETIYIAFLATVIAVPLAFILGFLSAKNIMSSNVMAFTVYGILRTIQNVVRSVEPLIWAIIFSIWVGIGPFAGMLALMIHSVASLAKQYSEIVECIDEGPVEAIQATGASALQVIWFAVVPQIILPYISFTIYRWDINVRMATIIGLVGGGGIGTLLMQYQGQALWNEVGTIVIVIAVIVWVMDTASAYIREAIK